jgi:arylsulfatase A-like enzyme
LKTLRSLLVVFLALPLSSGCGSSAVSNRDLVELAAGALVSSETALLDFGARDSRPHLVAGWSEDETATDGTSFVWATGASSRLRLFIAEPRPLELSFRSWPFRFPGAPPQRLTLELNGAPLAELTLEDPPAEYRLPLPASVQIEGDNVLEVVYAYHHSPRESLPDASDPRSLSVGWDWLKLEGATAAPGSIASGDALALPYGARVDYTLDIPRGSRLELDAVRPWGEEGASPYLAISIRTLSSREDRNVPGTSRGLALPLASESGLVALSFQARTGGGPIEGEGGLLLRRPVVVSQTSEVLDSPSPSHRPNVIVVLIDTLRADHLGCYGYGKETSPAIDAFAKDASLFERAFAQSSWTKPSVASLLTGLLPRSHTANRREDALPGEALTLAERLGALGYRTAGFVTNTNVAAEFGFAQGFETYELLLDADERLGYARAEVLVDRALALLEERGEEPFFLYLHFTDPHDPYTFTPGGKESVGSTDFMEALEAGEIPSDARTREKLLELYDEKIRYLDRELGRLFDDLRKMELYRDSLIVLVSDHGEEFEEHGWWRHGKTLYQEQLHIPFLVKWPEGAAAGRRLQNAVQQVDLVPTVLDFLGEPLPRDLPGRSLYRLVESAGTFDPVVSSYLHSDGREVESVVYRGQKLVRTLVYDREAPPFALFDLANDGGETKNLLEMQRPAFDFLDSLLRRPVEGPELAAVPAAIDEATRRRLEALGYIR